MDPSPKSQPASLRQERSNLSTYSLDSTPTIVASPPSPIQHRAGYRRVSSVSGEDTSYGGAGTLHLGGDNFEDDGPGQGLGIANVEPTRRVSVARVPVGSKSDPSTPRSGDPLLSPESALGRRDFRALGDQVGDQAEDDREGLPNNESAPSLFQAFTAGSETESLHRNHPSSTSIRSFEPSGSNREFECKTKRAIHHGRGNWLSVSILILAIYSSIFSGIWVLIAVCKPRYGQRISASGGLPPSTASLLCAAFAKSIELSFVTVFVAFLGQVLSRRAFVKKSKGITIAEMSMRSWITQPGTMITHWETVRYAAITYLGGIAICATVMAMFYTTASDALVQPKLRFGKTESRLIYGKVATQFANKDYVEDHCQTPIAKANDPTYYGTTCVAIEHAGQAYHNYLQYLASWTDVINQGNGSNDLARRPNAVGMMYDNTTVQGSWINVKNMTDVSATYGRTVNNVSLAMPHSGVFAAARDPINGIMQPQDLSGLGEYNIRASVPSPSINVLCASMSKDELKPMVFTEWPNSNHSDANLTNWPVDPRFGIPDFPDWLNKTAVDDVFGFGEKYNRRHPVFPKLPIPYNTVLNTTGWFEDSVYLLATSPVSSYMMCSLRASQTPNCSTEYHASMAGGSLSAHCEDRNDGLAYRYSQPNATSGVVNADWSHIASEWGMALSLGDGITDGASSNERLLTQLMPASPALDPSLPSIAEALAVLAGCTLLLSALDSPFIHYWNYSATVPTLTDPQYQGFNATLRAQDYESGGTQRWQGIFYIVLILVFVTNVFCLVYFIFRGGLVTDFIEPQNLFSLSLNSPSSQALDGSCGGGPEGEQFKTNWFIKLDPTREHFYIENGGSVPIRKRKEAPRPLDYEMESSPISRMYSKLSSNRGSLL